MRAVTSEAPPGGQGTTNLIGFDGHLSCAIDWSLAIASPSTNATIEKIHDSLSIEFFCCFVPSIIGAGKHTRCLSIISPCIAANDKNPPLSRKAEQTTLILSGSSRTPGSVVTRLPTRLFPEARFCRLHRTTLFQFLITNRHRASAALSRRTSGDGRPKRQPHPSGWCTLPGYITAFLPDRFR